MQSHELAPNRLLGALFDETGVSRKELARRVNAKSPSTGRQTAYSHTHVGRWLGGVKPKDEAVAQRIVAVLGELLGRVVTLADAGLGGSAIPIANVGLDFPQDRRAALEGAMTCWSTVHRRQVLRLPGAAAFTVPAMRWLAQPADEPAAQAEGVNVAQSDVDRLWATAAEAQVWDSHYGGGDWRTSQVLACLRGAAPLLKGTYSAETGQALHAALGELSRVVGWAALDAGHPGAADRLLIQALRLARSAGDIELGSYVLATMSLAAFLSGRPSEAAEMASAAYERGRGHAAPRVLAFCRLAQSRALARQGDGAGAGAALAHCETLLSGIRPGGHDPSYISYMTEQRLATDSVEIHRDLGLTRSAREWAEPAGGMPVDRFTRAVGIRAAVVATTYAIDRELEQAVAGGHRSVDILSAVHSPRAHSYLHDLVGRLAPWKEDARVRNLAHRVRTELPPVA
ncbi:hypothetical protein [Streptomyces sp. CBMA123]|uniref:hypothetical protein n=1 Tax=Streptomyces sp. CBMA123 TaxID=1896313 RepID=UPI00166200CB|nr:hypothetical protein [Streptomyces sp. CBMA123]MBD0692471.1 hypothetical protein [Streptomyces sp. CBMA123]